MPEGMFVETTIRIGCTACPAACQRGVYAAGGSAAGFFIAGGTEAERGFFPNAVDGETPCPVGELTGGRPLTRHFSMEYPSERVLMKATMASSSFSVRPRLPSSSLLMFDETSGSGQQFSPGLGSLDFSHLPSTSLVL